MKRWNNGGYGNYLYTIEIELLESDIHKQIILNFLSSRIKSIAKEAKDMAEGPVRVKVEV